MTIYREAVYEALVELADSAYQSRVWAGKDPHEVSSFTECVEQLFTDSGLSEALERGIVYGNAVDSKLRGLEKMVGLVDQQQSEARLLQDPLLRECRKMARETLHSMSSL